jgi:hypothetical protein
MKRRQKIYTYIYIYTFYDKKMNEEQHMISDGIDYCYTFQENVKLLFQNSYICYIKLRKINYI